jgi:4-hydroxybenzoate polyprenyltransferase
MFTTWTPLYRIPRIIDAIFLIIEAINVLNDAISRIIDAINKKTACTGLTVSPVQAVTSFFPLT